MASSIQNLLDQILNAVYGEEVRGAIHDSIEQCYSDVSTAKTNADTAVVNANTAITNANVATASATSAATSANTAATAANDAADSATTAATSANEAASSATSAASAANTAATSATNAASAASTAASDASAAALDVTAAVSSANSAASLANTAASNAVSATTSANNAATAATSAASDATDAAASATDAASAATDAADAVETALTDLQSTINAAQLATAATELAIRNAEAATADTTDAIAEAQAQAAAAETAATNATTAANNASSAASNANSAADSTNLANTECVRVTEAARTAITSSTTATDRATTAAIAIEGLTVAAQSTSYTFPPAAEVTTVDSHKHILFTIPKGDPGEPFRIKGDAYDTLAELQLDVTDPEVGDVYNVGTEPPYTLYRWTGVVWEDQGTIVPQLDALTTGEIAAMWDNGAAVVATKYLTNSGTFYFINSKILPALNLKVDKEQGKGLSTNDFTNEYKTKVDDNESGITSLDNRKVDKIEGKKLSTEDYTTAEQTKLAGIETGANKTVTDSALTTQSTNPIQNQAVATAVNTINTALDNEALQMASAYITDSSQKVYVYGEYCIYNRVLYQCTNNLGTGGTFNPSHWNSVTMLDVARDSNLYISVPAFSSLPLTINNSAITAEHVVGQVALSNPDAQVEAWNVSTAAGSATISGTIAGSTTLGLLLTRAKTIQTASS